MSISSITPSLVPMEPIQGIGMESIGMDESKPKAESFSKYLSNSLDDVNRMMASADTKMAEMAAGKSENLHDAMINIEKAETAFKLLVQVRNRALEAYHEVIRMQV